MSLALIWDCQQLNRAIRKRLDQGATSENHLCPMSIVNGRMSTSFVEYHGRGFWSWDGYLEHVLALLADRIGSSPSDEWLASLRDHWRAQSTGAFRGWIHPNLDEFLTSDKRREAVLALVEDLTSRSSLPREAQETSKLLEVLLRGEMNTDSSSPLDYMVSGAHPYKWSVNDQVVEQRDTSDERKQRP
jgi:hypothetical protein